MAQTIKRLIAPLIMMAGLALLPACWGLKRPSPVTGTIGSSCAANPFNEACDSTYEIARVLKISECIDGGAAATPTCTNAVAANSCIRDPFAVVCQIDSTFVAYIDRARSARGAYCELATADPTLCTGAAGSAYLDAECLDSPVGTPIYASCATRPGVVQVCTDAPFTRMGCGNIPNIEMLRIAHCGDSATAWDDGCVEATYVGAEAARNTACLTHGINADAGGHPDCAARDNVLAACGDNTPFALPVCDAVEGIGIKRTAACLDDLDANDGCEALITQTCTDTPLAGASCSDITGYSGFLNAFCAIGTNFEMNECSTTPASACRADPFGDMVTAGDETVDCLMDTDYDSARQALCRAGMEGAGECDTAAIAPVVCASSGANANPFAVFCGNATMIGGDDEIDVIRQAVLSTCLDGTSDDDNDICQNTMMARGELATACILAANTFAPRCDYTEYDDERTGFCGNKLYAWNNGCNDESASVISTARDQACIDDPQGNADDGHTGSDIRCVLRPAVTTACDIRNPFRHTVCNNIAGINGGIRTTYCETTTTAWNEGCTQTTHGEVATARRDACLLYGTDASRGGNNACATNQLTKNFCETNDPLATGREGCRDLDTFAEVVNTYCVTNGTEEVCKVVYSDWNGSFTPALATAPATGDTANRFLSGLTGASTVPTTDFTALTTTVRDEQTANATDHLALNDTVHGFGGQADDGVMFFGGQLTDNSYRYYAGIYSSTDLGAPLTEVSQDAVWRAWMRTSGKDPKNEYFELEVDYTAKAIGTLRAFFQSTSGTNTLYYKIDGDFGINGVITGSVAIGTESSGRINTGDNDYTLGVLTGLIGAEGVVAAFVSNTNTTTADGNGNGINPFVGGFVGIPALADHDAFRHYYAGQTDAKQLHANIDTGGEVAFMAATTGLAINGLTFDDTGQFTSFPVVEAGNGFALIFGETTDGDDRYRAGLLSGTDLGAPLLAQPTNANWEGKVYVSRHVNTGDSNKPMGVDLTLAVNFSAGTIKTSTAVTTAPSETIAISGEFRAGSNFTSLPLGVLGGTVTYNVGGTEHTPLPLIGLIGVEGAIGVFHGDSASGTDINMVGGFSVKP